MSRRALVLGGSHAEAFEDLTVAGWNFHVVAVGGATASGLANPNSDKQAYFALPPGVMALV